MGKRNGPDLEGALSRRRQKWLIDYMIAPDMVRARGDALAQKLRTDYPGVLMPNLGLSRTDAKDIIAYLAHESSRLRSGTTSEVSNSSMQR